MIKSRSKFWYPVEFFYIGGEYRLLEQPATDVD